MNLEDGRPAGTLLPLKYATTDEEVTPGEDKGARAGQLCPLID